MDARKPYQSPGTPEKTLLPCEGAPRVLLCAAPVLAGGDVTGAVGLLTEDRAACRRTPSARRWQWQQPFWQSRWRSENTAARPVEASRAAVYMKG